MGGNLPRGLGEGKVRLHCRCSKQGRSQGAESAVWQREWARWSQRHINAAGSKSSQTSEADDPVSIVWFRS